jgi:hypothetical protein
LQYPFLAVRVWLVLQGPVVEILEAFRMAEDVTGTKMNWNCVDENRIGDHICYYSDLRKMQALPKLENCQDTADEFRGDRRQLEAAPVGHCCVKRGL